MAKLSLPQIEKRLIFYAQHGYNVLLEGRHGVGKTKIIEQTFDNMGWKYHVLNASTIDPYMDFIGVPSKHLDEDKAIEYLEMILPKKFAYDELDALFLDEINRGRKETLNGLLDIIQNKSIKNKKLNRLKVIWSAQNPYFEDLDESDQIYHVKPLDPALKDRFHAFIDVPYQLNKSYLNKKYSDLSKPFIDWWTKLPEEMQYLCSPRRVDYAIQIFNDGGMDFLSDVIDSRLPLKQLNNQLIDYLGKNKRDELKQQLISADHNTIIKKVNLENLSVVIDLIKNNELPHSIVKSINPDYLARYLNVNPDKQFSNIIQSNVDKNYLNGDLGNIIINQQELVSDLFDNQLSNIIQSNMVFNQHTISRISNALLNVFYDLFYNTNNKFSLEEFYNSFKSSKSFYILKDKIISFFETILPIHKALLLAKKANDIQSIQSLTEKEEQLFSYYKEMIAFPYAAQSNPLAILLFWDLLFKIVIDFRHDFFKQKIESNTIYFLIFKVLFDVKKIKQIMKKYNNFLLLLCDNAEMYTNYLSDILKKLLDKDDLNSYNEFEQYINLNPSLLTEMSVWMKNIN